MVTRWLALMCMALLFPGPVLAQSRPPSDLKSVPTSQRVSSVAHCQGKYKVILKDGTTRTFNEYDLAFKVDTTGNGPTADAPALVPTGRVGDRAFVVFSRVDVLKEWLKSGC